MKYLQQKFSKFSRWRYSLLSLLLLAGVLHCGTSFNGGFYADDYFQRSYVVGSKALEEKGFFDGVKVGDWADFSRNQFLFFDPAYANYDDLLEFGVLPWWMHEDTKLHFFRPLSASLHYIEYRFFPDSPKLMHVISLFWYLLGLTVIFFFYRALGVQKTIALFAIILLILDNSIFHILPWIAARNMLLVMVFGFSAIYAYHRASIDWRWHAPSLILLILSLLAGEGGIGICMYLGAYLLTLDSRSWSKRILAILPYVFVTIIWRLYYEAKGYGAFGADLYIDPGHNPSGFLSRALWQYPGNLFELAAGIDTLSGQVRSDIRQNFAFAGVAIFIVLYLLLKTPLKQDKTLQFFAVACLFSIVPGLAVALSSRVMILPFVGFAILLATVFYYHAVGMYHGVKRLLAGIVIGYTLFMHVFVGFALASYMTWTILDFSGEAAMKRGGLDLGVENVANKNLIIINAQKPFWTAFIAHEFDYANKPLPAHVRTLSSSFHPITVTRVNTNTLKLDAKPGFQLDSQALINPSTLPVGHYAYLSQHLMGLTRNKNTPWDIGVQQDFDDIKISISALTLTQSNSLKAVPKTLIVELKQPLSEYRFVYWSIDDGMYQSFNLPLEGESVFLPGIFE